MENKITPHLVYNGKLPDDKAIRVFPPRNEGKLLIMWWATTTQEDVWRS